MNVYTTSDISNIKKIQYYYFKKNFINTLKKNKKIFDELLCLINRNNINNMNQNFDNLSLFIRKKETINNINNILKKYYRMVNNISSTNNDINVISFQINSRIFLSLFVIYGFPEILLSIKKEDMQNSSENNINNDIYKLSEKVIININNLYKKLTDNEALRQFVKSINMYSNCFMLWINNDKINKITELFYQWHEIQETINEINNSNKYDDTQKNDTINTMKNSQDNLIKLIKKLNPKFNINNLKIYSSLSFQLKHNFEKSYWDILKADLENKDLSLLTKILNEIQIEIINLRKKNKQFIDNFREKYDIQLIIQLIEKNLFSEDYLLSYSQFIIDNIIEMQAPIRNENMQNKWSIIMNDIKNKKYKNMNEYVHIILKFILNNIKDIKTDILNLHILNSIK
jgi:hypothetical protein